MCSQKLKVYCTYKNSWDLSEFNEDIEFVINQREVLTRDELLREVRGCHGIINNPRCPIDKEVLNAAGNQLKVVSTTSAGFNHIDVEECDRRGILVGYLPDTFTDGVAEFAIGLVLAATRKICYASKLANQKDWNKINDMKILSGKPIRGSTIGIFGLGRIGFGVAKRLSSFGVKKIIYFSRTHKSEADKLGYEYVDFDSLLQQSDILVCCSSLNKESEGIFNMSAFKKMKSTSVFVNVGRGAMVNQEDLLEALTNNVIGSAGLDVTTPEPLDNKHPFYSLPNCVITPHIAGDDDFSRQEIRRVGMLNLMNGLTGKPLVHQITFGKKEEKMQSISFVKEEIEEFVAKCMTSAGSTREHGKQLAECLIAADCRGHFSHGLSRLDKYVKDVVEGRTCKQGEPTVVKESAATALVDGYNLLGPVIGNFCMSLAKKKAKQVGVGIVSAFRATHYGIAGFYSMQALEDNLVGISMCNTSPIVFPTRSNSSTFGTNPISLAAPGTNSDSFVLDMATTTVALGKLEIRQLKNNTEPVPPTWVAEENGLVSTNIDGVLQGKGALFPLGGPEELGGYKGYGLTFLVEILTGILGGANFGPHIRKWGHSSVKEANLGLCFIAIDPSFFAENFQERLQSLMDHCRSLKPIDPSKPVLIPGDPEREQTDQCTKNKSIRYHINQLNLVINMSKELNVEAPSYTLS